jgi:hypothetical protein
MPDPADPQMQPIPWILSVQPSGQSLATFLGDVTVAGSFNPSGPIRSLNILTPRGGGQDDGPQLAAAASPAILAGGAFSIQTNTTLPASVTLSGATFAITPGKTLTVGQISAPLVQIFATPGGGIVAPGTVVVSSALQADGFPEWFGAINGFGPGPNPPDNSQPINMCIGAFQTTRLQPGSYYISNSVTVTNSHRRIIGAGVSQTPCISANGGPGLGFLIAGATQIVLTSPSMIGFQFGTVQAAKPAALTVDVLLKDFVIVRATAAAPFGVPGAAAIANPATGFNNTCSAAIFYWCGLFVIDQVYTIEHSIGFYIYGCVESWWKNCRHLRYTPGQNAANDYYAGFFQDNSANTSGYNSGNASIFITNCQAFSNCGTTGAPPYSFNAFWESYQGFTDTFIYGCESGGCGWGAQANGRQSSGPDNHTEDLLIAFCAFDSCFYGGIAVITGGPETAVQIIGNYVANQGGAPASFTPYAIGCSNTKGFVNIADNQILGAPTGNTAVGIYATNCAGINSHGNIITDLAQPIYATQSTDVTFADAINVSSVAPTNAAVNMNPVTGAVIDCKIRSSNGVAMPIGVALEAGSTKVEVRCSGIDGTNITGNAKLQVSGVNITAAGSYAWGLAQGILP